MEQDELTAVLGRPRPRRSRRRCGLRPRAACSLHLPSRPRFPPLQPVGALEEQAHVEELDPHPCGQRRRQRHRVKREWRLALAARDLGARERGPRRPRAGGRDRRPARPRRRRHGSIVGERLRAARRRGGACSSPAMFSAWISSCSSGMGSPGAARAASVSASDGPSHSISSRSQQGGQYQPASTACSLRPSSSGSTPSSRPLNHARSKAGQVCSSRQPGAEQQ